MTVARNSHLAAPYNMLQKALELLRLHDSSSIDLRFSLLLIGLIYCVHSYLRWRREHEASIVCMDIHGDFELTVLGGYYLQSSIRLSAYESKVSMPMAFWSRRTLRAI